MSFITGDMKYKDKIWLPIMVCPKCGYESTVTNICRECPKMPITAETTRQVRCRTHKCYHYRDNPDGTKTWLTHESICMVYTGRLRKFAGNRKRERKYKPKNVGELQDLWNGRGVVFDEKEK